MAQRWANQAPPENEIAGLLVQQNAGTGDRRFSDRHFELPIVVSQTMQTR